MSIALSFVFVVVFSLLEYSSLYPLSQREDKQASYYYTGSSSVLKVTDRVFSSRIYGPRTLKRAGYKTDGKKDPYFTAGAYCENKGLKIGGRRRQQKRRFKSKCALISSIFIQNNLRATYMIESSTYELALKRPGCVNLRSTRSCPSIHSGTGLI